MSREGPWRILAEIRIHLHECVLIKKPRSWLCQQMRERESEREMGGLILIISGENRAKTQETGGVSLLLCFNNISFLNITTLECDLYTVEFLVVMEAVVTVCVSSSHR